ncbi:response regulator transcription factor [Mucilaginibacter paludis]|uniref:Two component transcriptional regulator, winged helix family n=1 Tax=Mucilaginibacter paludis DSM 18603 TaxID=714943 RepID=H1YAM1_9SPHI|nr:response regulator transcription factor [Mucilaginibacter paludis]EHQ29141.1 two component transcriptional regulator, winged helix family [Mucilaginibacter paludis DSM 18603]
MNRICLIEDEHKVAAFIKNGLEEHEYLVNVATDGARGIELIENNNYDLLILDIMLPVVSGIDVCKHVRATNPHIPILMLTALGAVDDKVAGLKAGADDYLVKPFHFIELLARIEALLRRQTMEKVDAEILKFDDLELDTSGKTATRAGKTIVLTAKEYALLELFMRNQGKILTRQYIAERVWGIGFDTGTNFIDVYMSFLRNKIEKGFDGKLLHTAIGMGYVLKKA